MQVMQLANVDVNKTNTEMKHEDETRRRNTWTDQVNETPRQNTWTKQEVEAGEDNKNLLQSEPEVKKMTIYLRLWIPYGRPY